MEHPPLRRDGARARRVCSSTVTWCNKRTQHAQAHSLPSPEDSLPVRSRTKLSPSSVYAWTIPTPARVCMHTGSRTHEMFLSCAGPRQMASSAHTERLAGLWRTLGKRPILSAHWHAPKIPRLEDPEAVARRLGLNRHPCSRECRMQLGRVTPKAARAARRVRENAHSGATSRDGVGSTRYISFGWWRRACRQGV